MMNGKINLLSLYNDEELKTLFIEQFSAASHVTDPLLLKSEWSAAFRYLTENQINSFNCEMSLCHVNPIYIRMMLVEFSNLGLSLKSEKKHAYISTAFSTTGVLHPKIIIGYRGMQELLFRTKKIKNFAVQLVHQGDNFTWFGANESPIYSSTLNNSHLPIIAGFVKFEFWDGCIFCVSMTGEQLNFIADEQINRQIQTLGHAEGNLYTGAWRSQMLTICLRRYAYREVESFLRQRDITLFNDNSQIAISTDDDLVNELERINSEVS